MPELFFNNTGFLITKEWMDGIFEFVFQIESLCFHVSFRLMASKTGLRGRQGL